MRQQQHTGLYLKINIKDHSGLKCTWHVTLCLPALDPLAALVPPVVLVSQNHVHVDVVVGRRIQNTDVEAQEGEHPPGAMQENKKLRVSRVHEPKS